MPTHKFPYVSCRYIIYQCCSGVVWLLGVSITEHTHQLCCVCCCTLALWRMCDRVSAVVTSAALRDELGSESKVRPVTAADSTMVESTLCDGRQLPKGRSVLGSHGGMPELKLFQPRRCSASGGRATIATTIDTGIMTRQIQVQTRQSVAVQCEVGNKILHCF